MKNAIRNFFVSFRTNNNTRLLVCWITVIVILIANLIVFGFGASEDSAMSETAQKHYNLVKHGRFTTNQELTGITGVFRGLLGWIWSALRWVAWTFWFMLLVWSIVYIPIAFRDEAHLAWQKARRLMTEKDEGKEELPPSDRERLKVKPREKSETSVSEGIISKIIEQIRIFGREFFAAIVADMISKKRR